MILNNTNGDKIINLNGSGETKSFTQKITSNTDNASCLFHITATSGRFSIETYLLDDPTETAYSINSFELSADNPIYQTNNFAVSKNCGYKVKYEDVTTNDLCINVDNIKEL